MDHFRYLQGILHAEQVDVHAIAEAVGTPCYVYSKATLLDHYDRFAAAFASLDPLICYSIKSCANISICRALAERGAGMDLVSGGELHRAVLAGADPAMCVFAGVGKTDDELRESLEAGVGWFNIESEQEFEVLSAIAKSMGKTCKAALRVNPDVDAHTHKHTTTGTRDTKFGVDIDVAEAFFAKHGKDKHCRLTGLHVHLGSPIYSADPYVSALKKLRTLIDRLKKSGHDINMLDIGGGFGADYTTDQTPVLQKYADAIVPELQPLADSGIKIVLEPGRTLIANAGILLVRVMFTKQTKQREFVITDGGMNVLIRPCHYDAFHFMWPAKVEDRHVPARRDREMNLPDLKVVDVVGPICETGDYLARDRAIPPMKRGDLLAVFTAGAYGMVMASRYNTRPMPAEVMVDGDQVMMCRERESYDDLTAHEMKPRPVKLSGGGKSTNQSVAQKVTQATMR